MARARRRRARRARGGARDRHPAGGRLIRLAALAGGIVAATALDALACRPCDITDAAVAPRGGAQVQGGTSHGWQDGARFWVAPELTLVYGVAEGWEIDVAASVEHLADAEPGEDTVGFTGLSAFAKGLLRRGALQDEAGASVGLMPELLLPAEHDEDRVGGGVRALVSLVLADFELHANAGAGLARSGLAQTLVGVGAWAPDAWSVRPTAELEWIQEFGEGALVVGYAGALVQLTPALDLDFGIRGARQSGTWTTSVGLGIEWRIENVSDLFRRAP